MVVDVWMMSQGGRGSVLVARRRFGDVVDVELGGGLGIVLRHFDVVMGGHFGASKEARGYVPQQRHVRRKEKKGVRGEVADWDSNSRPQHVKLAYSCPTPCIRYNS